MTDLFNERKGSILRENITNDTTVCAIVTIQLFAYRSPIIATGHRHANTRVSLCIV